MRIIPNTIGDPAYCQALEDSVAEPTAEAVGETLRRASDHVADLGRLSNTPSADHHAELERLAAEVDPYLSTADFPPDLHRATVFVVDAVQALFPLADELGIVATDALYESLAALTFVAHLAEEANL